MKEGAIPRELFRSIIILFCKVIVEINAVLIKMIASLLDFHDGKIIFRFNWRGSKIAIIYI
jgi:hypothetical protein